MTAEKGEREMKSQLDRPHSITDHGQGNPNARWQVIVEIWSAERWTDFGREPLPSLTEEGAIVAGGAAATRSCWRGAPVRYRLERW